MRAGWYRIKRLDQRGPARSNFVGRIVRGTDA
jgi:hypothetical protein